MKKKTLGFVLCLGSLGLAGCNSDDGKEPTVTENEDGSITIDRLDPGESITLELELKLETDELTVNEDGSIHIEPGESVTFGPDLIPVDRAGRPIFDADGNPIPFEEREFPDEIRVETEEEK